MFLTLKIGLELALCIPIYILMMLIKMDLEYSRLNIIKITQENMVKLLNLYQWIHI
jgi:hypothetical protein